MSIEEKAKAYDEALEKAKKYMNEGYTVLMPDLFPELRESEDEKHRNWILEYLYDGLRKTDEQFKDHFKSAIDWLEKQKDSKVCEESGNNFTISDEEKIRKELMLHLQQEANSATLANNRVMWEKMLAWVKKQKYDRMKPIYDARESFESALEKAWNDYHNGYENVDKLEDDYVECAHAKGFREGYLFGIEKQKEQSLRDFIDDFPYSDQKPIPKFKVGDRIVSTKNSRLTYEILEVGHVNELGNIEYKVEIFTDGKPDEPHNVHYMECCKVDEWGKLMEQKSIEDVIKDITKNKESAIKFLKSAGIMDDNGELAEMYRSEQKPADHCSIRDEFDLDGNLKELNYDNRIQYDSVKSGIEAFASTYSFNIESKLFPQLTKEQQQLWREEIEQAVIAGGESGIELARDYRYKENRMIEWSEKDRSIMDGIQLVLESWDRAHSSIAGLPSLIPNYISWLKSLRPQWKPSEEQMEALRNAAAIMAGNKPLIDLYEQFKKL
ncbi:MAG: hypothetical protein J6T10_13050 [Methanobrevibacter sp.]|nr:hypothetical protein [Methanobrevibacter sp.]